MSKSRRYHYKKRRNDSPKGESVRIAGQIRTFLLGIEDDVLAALIAFLGPFPCFGWKQGPGKTKRSKPVWVAPAVEVARSHIEQMTAKELFQQVLWGSSGHFIALMQGNVSYPLRGPRFMGELLTYLTTHDIARDVAIVQAVREAKAAKATEARKRPRWQPGEIREIVGHQVRRVQKKYACYVCGGEWSGPPRQHCPRVPRYTWQDAPTHLLTKRQLRDLELVPGGDPAGVVISHNGRAVMLYDKETAVFKPKKKLTITQLEAFEQQRAWQHRRTHPRCSECNAEMELEYDQWGQPIYDDMTGHYWCDACQERFRREEEES